MSNVKRTHNDCLHIELIDTYNDRIFMANELEITYQSVFIFFVTPICTIYLLINVYNNYIA